MASSAPPSDLTELVPAARSGDELAWAVLVERFAPLVWAVARAHRLDQADAAEVCQTVWLRLVQHLGRLRDPQALPGWLRTTTRHEALRVHRAQRRAAILIDVPPDSAHAMIASGTGSGMPAPEEAVLADERSRVLLAALALLTERCRALLRVLAYSPDLRYRDISASLGLPVGSIGPTRARCLHQLHRQLVDLGYLGPREVLG